jgi:hypothetical protein
MELWSLHVNIKIKFALTMTKKCLNISFLWDVEHVPQDQTFRKPHRELSDLWRTYPACRIGAKGRLYTS